MRNVAGIPNQLSELEKLENEKQLLVQKLEQQKLKINALEGEVLKQNGLIDFMRGKSYSYKHLKLKPETFKLLCGVSTEQFELLMDCIRPYLSLLDSGELRVRNVIDRATQYMAVLTV